MVGDLDARTIAWLVAVGFLVAVGRHFAAVARAASRDAFSDGLLVGLVVAAAVTVIEALGSGAAPFGVAYRSQAWWAHANLWGAAVLAPAVFVTGEAMARARPGSVFVAILAAAAVVVGSGSRSALFGLLAGVVVVWLVDRWGRRGAGSPRTRIVAVIVLVVLTGLVWIDGGWRARLLGSVGFQPQAAPARNLFDASENLVDGVWWSPNVMVTGVATTANSPAVHRLERATGRWTDRLQQRVRLEPDEWYSFSADVFVERHADPVVAFVGWAARPEGDVEVVVRFPTGGAPQAHTAGGAHLSSALAHDEAEGWRRLQASFRVSGDAPVPMEVGLAPRTVEGVAGPVLVRRLQLEVGERVGPYEATMTPDRTAAVAWSAVRSRVDGYRVIVELVVQRPWTGWGRSGFAAAMGAPGFPAPGVEHEHSLALFFALRYGVIGLLALTVLGLSFVRHGSRAVAIVVAVGFTNVVDLTFLSDAVYVATALLVAVGSDPSAARSEPGGMSGLAGGRSG
jgi:hypothetical protein